MYMDDATLMILTREMDAFLDANPALADTRADAILKALYPETAALAEAHAEPVQ